MADKIDWCEVQYQISLTRAKNVTVRRQIIKGKPESLALFGNDGTVLSVNPAIAMGYVKTDWDAINCQATR